MSANRMSVLSGAPVASLMLWLMFFAPLRNTIPPMWTRWQTSSRRCMKTSAVKCAAPIPRYCEKKYPIGGPLGLYTDLCGKR